MEKPIFLLNYNLGACSYIISINGIEISESPETFSVVSRVALNPWVRPGENFVTVKMYDRIGNLNPKASGEIEISLVDKADRKEERKSIITSDISPSFKDNEQESHTLSVVFVSDLENCDPIYEKDAVVQKPSLELFNQLYQKYEDIFQVMKNKNLDGFLSMCKLKNEEWSRSMYETYEERLTSNRNRFSSILQMDQMEMLKKHLKLRIFNQGKLFSIQYPYGFDAICFSNEDESQFEYVPICFYFSKKLNDFVLIR